MFNVHVIAVASLAAVVAVGCGGAPKPEARLSSSEGAIRGAEEAGALNSPQAALHLKLAKEERDKAVDLVNHGENERASHVLERAEADAELAVALAREATAKDDAQKTLAEVQDLKKKAAQ